MSLSKITVLVLAPVSPKGKLAEIGVCRTGVCHAAIALTGAMRGISKLVASFWISIYVLLSRDLSVLRSKCICFSKLPPLSMNTNELM